MSVWKKYQLFCITENANLITYGTVAPSKCPHNREHTVAPESIFVLEERKPDIVNIREEEVKTGGYLKYGGFSFVANPRQTTKYIFTHPIPINVLAVKLFTPKSAEGDFFRCVVAPNSTIGVLGEPYVAAPVWGPGAYETNAIVYWVGHNYRAIRVINADDQDSPDESENWRVEPVNITLVSPAINMLAVGFLLSVESFDFGTILAINGNVITVNGASVAGIAPGTPVQFTVERCERMPLTSNATIIIGESKIGGSYLPANTPVVCEYENNSDEPKTMNIHYEYLF